MSTSTYGFICAGRWVRGRYLSIQKYWALKRSTFRLHVAELLEKRTLILLCCWYRRYYVIFNPILLFSYKLCIRNTLHAFCNEVSVHFIVKLISRFTKYILTLWKLIYIYIHIYIYICVCVCIYIYIHTHIYIYKCVYRYIHTHTHIYIYIYRYIHTHTHTHIYIYIYIYRV